MPNLFGHCRAGATDFYPASGYRTGSSGGLSNVGAYGYAWSSAPDVASGMRGSLLNFNSSFVGPEYSDRRAYAFPVRCKPGNVKWCRKADQSTPNISQ